MQLTLSDFDSKDSPPTWLSQEEWEDILALSVLPGPLDSLCVSFASASEAWYKWYTSPYPEQEALPLAESEAIKAQEDKGGCGCWCGSFGLKVSVGWVLVWFCCFEGVWCGSWCGPVGLKVCGVGASVVLLV